MTTSHAATLDSIRSARRQIFDRLAETPEAHLNKKTRWGRGPADARYLFLRYSDHEEEHALQIEHSLRAGLGWQPTKVQLLLGMAEQTRGNLLAALVGLTDDDLDVAPVEPPGEWTLRQTLAHLIDAEHSYRINTLHAIDRFRAGEEHGELPNGGEASRYMDLSFTQMLVELDSARTQSLAALDSVTDDVLPAPAVWMRLAVDVNWRLMRFSHHEREHTAHIQKWRVQTGRHQTDAQRLLGLGWQSHGLLRSCLVGVPDELFSREPWDGEWSVEQTLAHIQDADTFFERQIHAAE